jgi:acetylornithine deacetylase/succinyl-diaminopimelate desuccinylase-like protein
MNSITPRRRRLERIAASALVVAVAAAAAALIILNRRMEQQIRTETYVPKAVRMTSEIGLLQQYVRIDTSNPPGNESAGARWIVERLARGGIRAEVISSAPNRTNVYARIRGRNRGDGLILLNHIDVVPVKRRKNGWSKPPFSADIAANMVFGRGTADMKGIAVCQLEAFLDVAAARRTPEHDIVFLAVADEEAGSTLGVRWLLDHRPDVFEGTRYVLTEGGVTELQKEKLTYFGIEIGAKELTELQLVAPSREQLQHARIALEPYFDPRDAERVLPGVRRFFRSVAPLRIEFVSLLSDIDRTIATGKLWLLPDGYRDLLTNTIWAGGVSVRPDGQFAMRVSMLNLPEEDPDKRLAWLERTIAPHGTKIGEINRKEGPIPMSPDDTPLFALIALEARAEYGPVAVGPEVLFGSTSDSRFLRPRGFVCYGIQPFPLDFFQTLGVHGVNERVRLDWFNTGVKLMRRIVWAYAFGTRAGKSTRGDVPKAP